MTKSFVSQSVKGKVVSVSVNGDAVNSDSAQLQVMFQSNSGDTPETLILGAGAATSQFIGTCTIALAAMHHQFDVTVSAAVLNPNDNPTILSISLARP